MGNGNHTRHYQIGKWSKLLKVDTLQPNTRLLGFEKYVTCGTVIWRFFDVSLSWLEREVDSLPNNKKQQHRLLFSLGARSLYQVAR